MTKISRKGGIGILRDSEDTEKISYCPRCMKHGLYKVLEQRVYLPEEIINSKDPDDSDKWKQCHFCGQVVPIYELKKESTIRDPVDSNDNKFDTGKSIVGLNNKWSNNPRERERQKLIDKANQFPEADMRQAALSGCEVQMISDDTDEIAHAGYSNVTNDSPSKLNSRLRKIEDIGDY
jgi:hypothetical protein